MGKLGLTRSIFRVSAAWQTVVILVTILLILYVLSAFYTGKGEFVMKVDRTMADDGFLLSDTKDFSEKKITLRDDAVENATNISIFDLPSDINDVNGKHNGKNYLAYTFYLKNETGQEHDYRYSLELKSVGKHADEASWIMVFQNDKQLVYAKKAKTDGEPEKIYNKWEFPFIKQSMDPEFQQKIVTNEKDTRITQEQIDYHDFTKIEGLYELQTKPWENDNIICTGSRQKLENNGIDKYTVVMWLEGDDPDCHNDIIGGHIEMNMLFKY